MREHYKLRTIEILAQAAAAVRRKSAGAMINFIV